MCVSFESIVFKHLMQIVQSRDEIFKRGKNEISKSRLGYYQRLDSLREFFSELRRSGIHRVKRIRLQELKCILSLRRYLQSALVL